MVPCLTAVTSLVVPMVPRPTTGKFLIAPMVSYYASTSSVAPLVPCPTVGASLVAPLVPRSTVGTFQLPTNVALQHSVVALDGTKNGYVSYMYSVIKIQ